MKYGRHEIDLVWFQTRALKRLATNVRKSGDCIVWQGAPANDGYGRIELRTVEGRYISARVHRVAAMILHGDLLDFEVDHQCRNRLCISAAHLVPMEGIKNIQLMHSRIKEDRRERQLPLLEDL